MPLPVAGLALSGVVDVGDDRLVIDRFQVDLGGPSLRGSATVKDITGVLDVDAEALVENMPVDLLATYWPEALGTNARDWVTGNLSLGIVRAAGASIRARVPADKPDDGEVTEIGGMIVFDGVRVNYLDGLPAVHEVAGNATFDAERFDIALNSGRLRDLSLTGRRHRHHRARPADRIHRYRIGAVRAGADDPRGRRQPAARLCEPTRHRPGVRQRFDGRAGAVHLSLNQ